MNISMKMTTAVRNNKIKTTGAVLLCLGAAGLLLLAISAGMLPTQTSHIRMRFSIGRPAVLPQASPAATRVHAAENATLASPAACDHGPDTGLPPNSSQAHPQPTAARPGDAGAVAAAGLVVADHVSSEGHAACNPGQGGGLKFNASHELLLSPVVVVAHNRVGYLARTMMVLLSVWRLDPAAAQKFPLFVSVDGGDQRTLQFAAAWKEAAGVQVISRVRDLQQCNNSACNISLHFKYLLQLFFECHQAPFLTFVEEDLAVAPDFFSYMEAASALLQQDSSLWCISAWNDHGQIGRASNVTALYRTDVMPGLGWMTNKQQGLELAKNWPAYYWDDWMRKKEVRRGRQCVFPEVARSHTFGKIGTHGGQFYDEYLSKMVLNDQAINWKEQSLTYLLKDKYAVLMSQWLTAARSYDDVNNISGMPLQEYCSVTQAHAAAAGAAAGDMLVKYHGTTGTDMTYVKLARLLAPMLGDLRDGSPRASYEGVVMVRCRGQRLFLKPA